MDVRTALLAVLALSGLSNAALAAPSRVIIIRHGEKPNSGNELDSQGCERAYLLPTTFFSRILSGPPAAIFASAPDNNGGSVRPVETIAPTAANFGIQVLDPTTRVELSQAVSAVDAYSGTVVMAWEHDTIPGLAQSFGLRNGPAVWPDAVFDEAWVLNFPENGGEPALDIVPEGVLPGDNPLGGIPDWADPPGAFNPTAIPPKVAAKCVDDKKLDKLAQKLAKPALSQDSFAD